MVRPGRTRWLAQIAVCCWVAPLLAQAPPAQPPTAPPQAPMPDAPPPFSTGPRIVARLGDGGLWHGSVIRALAVSPDEQTLASYGSDNRIALWDLATGKLRRRLEAPALGAAEPDPAPGFAKKAVPRVALALVGPSLQFSGDGKTIAAIDILNRQAIAWDAQTGKLVQHMPLTHAEDKPLEPPAAVMAAAAIQRGITGPIALSNDGRRIILANAGPSEIAVLQGGRKEPVARLQGHEGRILGIAVAPDGRSLLSASEDQTVRLWDLDAGKLKETYAGHRAAVIDVAFAADGKRFVSASADGTLVCRDTASGKIVARIVWKPAQVQETPEGTLTTRQVNVGLQNVWLEPDNVAGCQFTIQTGSATSGFAHESVARWDLGSGRELSRHVHYIAPGTTTTATVLFAGALGTRTTAAPPRTSVIAPKRKLLARATPHCHIQLAALDTGAAAGPDASQRQPCADVEMWGDVVAVVRSDDPTVYLWNWKSKALRPLAGHTARPILGGFTADGQRLVSASHHPADRSLSVWDVAAAKESTQIPGWNPGAVSATTSAFTSARSVANATFRVPALSPDGKLIALRGQDGKLRVVESATGKDVASFDFTWKGEGAAAFTPDAKHVIVSDAGEQRRTVVLNGAARMQRDSVSALYLFDAAIGKDLGQLNRGNYDFLIGRIAIAGRFVIAGCKDGGLRLIERGGGRHVRDLVSTKRGAEADERLAVLSGVNRTPFFVMAPDQYTVALREADGRTVRLIEIPSGQERARFAIPAGTLQCMGFAPDGRHFVTGSSDGTAAVWDLLAGQDVAAGAAADAEALWNDLAADAARALRALARLRADPARAVEFCADKLKTPSPSAAVARKKIAELDSTNFAVRQKAQDDLYAWGEAVRGPLEKAAENPNASGEMKLRLDAVLRKLDESPLEGDRLRELRCLELLEHLPAPAASALLRNLARPEHPLAHLAEAALQRQARRSAR